MKTDLELQLGQTVNRWTVLATGLIQNKRKSVQVQCVCGTVKIVRQRSIMNGDSKSCGCLVKETTRALFTKHGLKETPEYSVWESMRQRCNDPKCASYSRYGGRGIKVCARWDSFEMFLHDMGKRPSSEHSIERVDNEKDYLPENCVWATRVEQGNNKRNNRLITAKGKTLSVSEWHRETGIALDSLYWRLNVGWEHERIVTP